jgi:hypothetical protein
MSTTRPRTFPAGRTVAALLAACLAWPAFAEAQIVPAAILIGPDVKTPPPAAPHKQPKIFAAAPAAPAPVEASKAAAALPAAGSLALDRSIVRYATSDDGTLWARGASFKASFGREGASFVPCLGAAAPRNFPVGFRLASVRAGDAELAFDAHVEPTRSGELVSFDRGSLVERYTLRPEGIEQSFVFEEPLGAGELVLRIALATELGVEQRGEGLELANDLARIGYGRATVIDARP